MKLKSILFVLLVFASAYADDCLYGNCKNGKGVLLQENGMIYSGKFKNFKKHGTGIVSSGNYKEGTYTYTYGVFYKDNFADGSKVFVRSSAQPDAVYRANRIDNSKTRFELITKDTADLYCYNHPTNHQCVSRFIVNNIDNLIPMYRVFKSIKFLDKIVRKGYRNKRSVSTYEFIKALEELQSLSSLLPM